jgi:putative membrane protein
MNNGYAIKEMIMKTRSILITGGVLILAALVLGTLMPFLVPTAVGGSIYGGMMGPGMMGGYGMMAGFGWLGMLTMALFWVGVVLLVVWGLSNLFTTQLPRVEPDAEEILKQRFARGEINREEFVQARETLR